MPPERGSIWLPAGLEFLSGLPDESRRRRRILALQVFVDDSGGRNQGNWFAMAGLMCPAEEWAAFSEEWSACLNESPRIQYFKMHQAAKLKGEFSGFTKQQRDDKLRTLLRIINQHAPVLFTCTAHVGGLAAANPRNKWFADPYFWPYQLMIMSVAEELSQWSAPWKGRFEIVFDEQVIFGPRARAWYPIIRAYVESKNPAKAALLPVDPVFKSDSEFLPLQAADLFAWLFRRGTNRLPHTFDWTIEEINKVQYSKYSKVLSEEKMQSLMARAKNIPRDKHFKAGYDKFREIFGDDPPVGSGSNKKPLELQRDASNKIKDILERFSRRFTLDNPRIVERYREGELGILLHAKLKGDRREFVAHLHRFAGPDLSDKKLRDHAREMGKIRILRNFGALDAGETDSRNGRDLNENSMFIRDGQLMQLPELVPLPAFVRLGCANCIYGGRPDALYLSLFVGPEFFFGGNRIIRNFMDFAGRTISQEQGVHDVIERRPEVLQGIGSNACDICGDALYAREVENALAGLRMFLGTNAVWLGGVEPVNRSIEITDVVLGPCEFGSNSFNDGRHR